jgi:hypothetical protein
MHRLVQRWCYNGRVLETLLDLVAVDLLRQEDKPYHPCTNGMNRTIKDASRSPAKRIHKSLWFLNDISVLSECCFGRSQPP